MNLQSTDFELFDVPARFAQDLDALQQRWKALQREAHPDRFSAQGAAAQRVAMQWSVRINEAWQRLRDPLRRAAYLCELNGAPVDVHGNTKMPPAFLMQQMAWHEQLDEARSAQDFDALDRELAVTHAQGLARCAQLLDEAGNFAAAAAEVRALMFIERLQASVDDKRDASAAEGGAASGGQ
ncbi:Fe-S protein assembly co-chaperone HscB [Pseudorhodoferax sp. Leaf265]|uniref:Fe-S protein assembly co-chaperone HscB n=1 Tax=Pseudorhodoferax sp. Leaf265 TaxID=1736315 RepID=UPI0006F6E34F|nr:Fe-S protein assembly co-chaperone HscB [Pseudorhodoferax sp. Leaf265]KQP21431.1 co-chaperone HscB [Pseudorhodoferax sp. Leaf265]